MIDHICLPLHSGVCRGPAPDTWLPDRPTISGLTRSTVPITPPGEIPHWNEQNFTNDIFIKYNFRDQEFAYCEQNEVGS